MGKNTVDKIKDLEYPINLFTKIDSYRSNEMNSFLLNKVLDTLTDKEKDIIEKYYRDKLSLASIGKVYSNHPERIRQIRDRAIKKLQHPGRICYLYLYDYINNLESENKRLKQIISSIELQKDRQQIKIEECLVPINTLIGELNFSVRLYNCLYRANYRTVKDLINTLMNTKDDFYKIRNLGKKGLLELEQWFIDNTTYKIKLIID